MKSENGLTILATIFLVLIIAVFVFGVVYFARMQLDERKVEDIKTNMLLIQAKVKKTNEDYILEKKDEILVGSKLSEMKENEIIKEFIEDGLLNEKEKGKKYYVLNNNDLNTLGLSQIVLEDNEFYIVEYTQAEVFYTKGLEIAEGKICYSLDDINDMNNNDETYNAQNESTNKTK